MLVCLNCGNKHNFFRSSMDDGGKVFCVTCGPTNRLIEEIDDLLTDIIVLLNKNGLETIHCCEGHFEERLPGSSHGGYISIHDKDKNAFNILADIPDKIFDFDILCEEAYGPKTILNLANVNKIVIRFKCTKLFKDIYSYTIAKVDFYKELNDRLIKIFGEKK